MREYLKVFFLVSWCGAPIGLPSLLLLLLLAIGVPCPVIWLEKEPVEPSARS
jgi:hypothetical protein